MSKKITTELFIQRAKNIHKDKYDYNKVIYKDAKQKVEIICKKHGSFFVSPNNHLSKKSGCPVCKGGVRLSTENFINKANKIHNGIYNYQNVVYHNAKTKIEIICPIHGSFWQLQILT